jgi:predicted Zn-dependent protease
MHQTEGIHLMKYGYLGVVKDSDESFFDENVEIALRKYQNNFKLPVTGIIDNKTINQIKLPRCGVPDFYPEQNKDSKTSVLKFLIQGNSWDKKNITYRIENFTNDLTHHQVRHAIIDAFNIWVLFVPLDFSVDNSDPDINILFGTGNHDDCSDDFDGAGGILAHAFYPPPNGSLAGDIHFDDDETWDTTQGSTFDIISVAAHEIGHTLGLKHSNAGGALMYPNPPYPRQLQDDDVQGITRIYGLGFSKQTGTILHETDNSFEFLLAPNKDLFAIKKRNTGTSSTEVHVLSARSNYQEFIKQTGTVLHETNNTFQFLLAPNRDLFAIKKKNTGTNSTEVHVLSARSNYQEFIKQTGTILHETDNSFEFLLAPNKDLYAIKKRNTGTFSTEVHVLSARSNYQRFVKQTGTILHETDSSFEFEIAQNLDIYAIKKNHTGTHHTEIHVLSYNDNYNKFKLQKGTALHETDNSFQFALSIDNEIYAIKKKNTGTNSTEVHVLSAPKFM